MFLLFPYSTNAPVYYWPFTTLGLILANVVIFIAMTSGAIPNADEWMLWYGEGLHPLQWITNIFTHADIVHLVGNMLFLWIFGLVVEGKLGWGKFLSCYLGIGVFHSMLEQLVMLNYTGSVPGAVGASAAIFGIMAMAAIWAPLNEIEIFYIAIFRTGTFEVSIAVMSFCYTMLELAYVLIFGTAAASSLLHLSGFLVGLPLAIVLLKLKLVDCEGWDAFHVWSGNYGGFKEEPDDAPEMADIAERSQQRDENQLVQAKTQLQQYVKGGNLAAALLLYEKMRHIGGGLVLDRQPLFALIKQLQATNRFRESAPLLAELIRRFPEGADTARVKLAQICVVELDRPAKALEVLQDIDPSRLSPPQLALAKKIATAARAKQAEGDVELDTEL